MNYSRYERFGLLIFFIIILILFEIIFIINIMREKNELYISFSGVVMKNNIGLFIVNDKDMKILYKNKWLPVEEVPLEEIESASVWKIRAEAEGYTNEEFSLLIDWYQDALMISSELEKKE